MKSNYDYLKEILSDNNEGLEFLDALIEDHKDDLKQSESELSESKDIILGLEERLEELEKNKSNYKTINCVIGEIEYLEPDNLKLQIIMEEFKEEMEEKYLLPH